MPRLAFRLAFCIALGLAVGCGDAARENPLDPLSDGFRDEGAVSGRVVGVYPPFPGRPGVQVRLVPVGPPEQPERPELATRTDPEGRFALAEVPAGAYAVVAEQEGFRGASDTVMVAVGRVAEATVQLDALPVVTEQSLRSVHIVRWFPDDPVFQLTVEVAADDADRPEDVAAAALAIPDLGVSLPLDPVAGASGRFTATFDDAELPAPGVEGLLGHVLRIEVRDASGNASLGPPLTLVRIIEHTPLTESPQGRVVVPTPMPTLTWRPSPLPFAFTYRVEVVLVTDVQSVVETAEGIDVGTTSYTVQQALPSGEYFWTVWVVDAFGNRSRSKEAGFIVP